MGSLKGSARTKIQSLIHASSRDGVVQQSNEFYDLPGRQAWGPNRKPRVAGDRNITQIDRSELLAACYLVATQQNINDSDELLKATSTVLGFKSIRDVIRGRLGKIVEEALAQLATSHDESSLQNDPAPSVSENVLVRLGYEPRLDPASRWMFMLNYAVPDLTKDGVINSINALISYLDEQPETSVEIKEALQIDLRQLQRYTGYR